MDPYSLPYAEGRQVAVVTGANCGLGFMTSLHLYLHGWTVYLACRDMTKAQKACADIVGPETEARKHLLPANVVLGEVQPLHLDLASLQQTHDAAQAFVLKEPRLHLLINNAGIMAVPYAMTGDGFELQVQTNFVGHWLFTQLLVPALLAVHKDSPDFPRVIFLSSSAHLMARPADELTESNEYSRWPDFVATWFRYAISKTAVIQNAIKLGQLHPEILALTVDPGFATRTNLNDHFRALPVAGTVIGWMLEAVNWAAGLDNEPAAYASLKCALSPTLTAEKDNGRYLGVYGREQRPSSLARNQASVDRTWVWVEQQLASRGFEV